MQCTKLINVRMLKVDVQALTLIYVASTVNGHINHYPLLNLPDGPEIEICINPRKESGHRMTGNSKTDQHLLVNLFKAFRNLGYFLDRTFIINYLVLQGRGPNTHLYHIM